MSEWKKRSEVLNREEAAIQQESFKTDAVRQAVRIHSVVLITVICSKSGVAGVISCHDG